MPKRAIYERSRRERFLDVPVGVHILLVVEQSSLESQSRGCTKTSILTWLRWAAVGSIPTAFSPKLKCTREVLWVLTKESYRTNSNFLQL